MVSTSDTARHIQFGGLKQDAAEAAFKARHSFASSDAFKQIFDGIDKSNKPAEPPRNEAAEQAKPEVHTKIHKHNHKHHGKPEDKSDKHADCDMKEKCSEDNDANTIKPTKTSDQDTDVKKVKNETRDKDDDCHFDKCEQTATDAAHIVEPKTTAAAPESIDITITDNCDGLDHIVAADNPVNEELVETEETLEVVASDAVVIETAPAPLTDKANLVVVPQLAATLIASLQPKPSEDGVESLAADIKSTIPVISPVIDPAIGDFQKSVGTDQKAASEKTGAHATAPTSDSQVSDDVLSVAVKAEAEPAKEPQTETPKENGPKDNGLSKRDLFKAANEKHESHQEFMQDKFSAPKTHPAAGDRAISAAQTAPDSPAPTLNGSAGGGSPIATKGAITANTAISLDGLHAMQGEQVTFAGAVRNTKEAQVNLMLPSEQVAVHLNRMAKSGLSQYDLHLHPAELGRVDIRLEIAKDGTVQATVTADNQQTFDMLQRDSRSLERALQQAGLQADSGSLSFNLRSDGQNQAHQHAQHNHGHARSKWIENNPAEDISKSKVLSFDVGTGHGRVDLRV